MANSNVLDIRLPLTDIEHLFEAPDLGQFSTTYHENNYTSGVEFIGNELYANTSFDSVRATIVLPDDQIRPGLEKQAREAVRRYCRGRLIYVEQDIRATRWQGWRALAVAVVALFVFFGASRWLADSEIIFLQILSEALSIAGWIALWFPLEMLTFTVWQHRLDKKIYTMLYKMELVIQSESTSQE